MLTGWRGERIAELGPAACLGSAMLQPCPLRGWMCCGLTVFPPVLCVNQVYSLLSQLSISAASCSYHCFLSFWPLLLFLIPSLFSFFIYLKIFTWKAEWWGRGGGKKFSICWFTPELPQQPILDQAKTRSLGRRWRGSRFLSPSPAASWARQWAAWPEAEEGLPYGMQTSQAAAVSSISLPRQILICFVLFFSYFLRLVNNTSFHVLVCWFINFAVACMLR